MKKTLDTMYEQIGGMETCRQLSDLFHERIAGDPVLRELFPKNLAPTTEWLALFLAERLGGPRDYTARRGKQSLICRHAHLPIGAAAEAAWLAQMFATMEATGLPEPARQNLGDFFRRTAATLSDPLLPLYHLSLDELKAVLEQDPARAADNHGRSLLKEAAGRWDLPRVQLLLACGGNIQVRDRLGHDALSQAAGAFAPQPEEAGRAVVSLLIQEGANVNVQCGPCRQTPLHMAARRGTVAVAEVLLDAGAEIEAKDAKGETPLRRAVNCRQERVVRLLLSRGADPLTQDRKGQTALAAAHHVCIHEALSGFVGF